MPLRARVGTSQGSVMWRKARDVPAPSTRAASYRALGTVWRAARITRVKNGNTFHVVMSTTRGNANAGSISHVGLSVTHGSSLANTFATPKDGLRIQGKRRTAAISGIT